MAKLTKKQQRFVDEYLIDLNATQAAIRAGYSEKTAYAIGAENLSKPQISEAVAERMKDRERRTEITQDRVLQELARIAFFDIRKLYREDGSMKAPHELDDEAAAVLSGVDVTEEFAGSGESREHVGYTKKAKVFDKGSALALAMRHLGMLNDKLQLTLRPKVTVKDLTGRKDK
ncbi:terminase small subunit [Pandoraea sp. NPDC090278]|uniref:terminase small subunit n=1 Tax=Pandoraea sp. NPDC090278 TaxID=3364391 RepID=UPI00383A9D7C